MPATTILIDGTPTNGADPWVDSLVWGGAWTDGDGGKVTITYSTPSAGYLEGEQSLGWSPEALAALDQALAVWESVANIDFVAVDSPFADALFWVGTQSQAGGPGVLGWSEIPGYTDHDHLNTLFNGEDSSWSAAGLAKGGYGFVTLVHEIGHLLGLAHPHDGGSADDATTFPGVDWPYFDYGDGNLNQGIYTTMGYNPGWPATLDDPVSETWGLEAGPMALDIAAIQAIYGASTGYATGNDVYVLPTANAAGAYWSSIWDANGIDTISNAGSSNDSTIDLNAATAGIGGGGMLSYGYDSSGAAIHGGFTIARNVVIENAIGGSGNDTITGNSGVNRLEGGAGNDTLIGGAGNDTMIGGLGDDTYEIDQTDVIVENVGEGIDTIRASFTYTLGAAFENLTLFGTAFINGTGNSLDNVLTGNGAANQLTGGVGNDTLIGGAGGDLMIGGVGNDIYDVDSTLDTITELAGEGIDTVRSSINYVLGITLENLELTGNHLANLNGTGNSFDNILTGNDGSNRLEGGGGNDTLIGGGGSDTLVGGVGDDTYDVDFAGNQWSVGDVVIEKAGEGNDTVRTSANNYFLGANVENLVLMGTDHLDGNGNSLNNVLTGNSGNNRLDGGAGADTMAGGLNNDIYTVDNYGDVVVEAFDEGSDIVLTYLGGYTLAANVEMLQLMGGSNIDGFGNAGDNRLIGNDGDNKLYGGAGNDYLHGGSDGLDTLIGGLGDDTYHLWGAPTILVEEANGGFDTIEIAWADEYTLGENFEGLILWDGSIKGIGNAANNRLEGNEYDNILDGRAGADTMVGGYGDDTYYIDDAGDVIIESEDSWDGGRDIAYSSAATYTLDVGVERLILTGTASINATGSSWTGGFSSITGNSGDNILDTGTGFTNLIGGLGNDIYIIRNTTSQVIELAGEGIDTARIASSVWFYYTLADNIENVELMSGAVIGYGNSLANRITGNELNNKIDGGLGADTMVGGLGDDTYVVDNSGDIMIEMEGGGDDLVQASVSYVLSANVEGLELLGTGAINGTGNDFKNIISGNDAANILDGGAGDDVLAGGGGNDLLYGGADNDVLEGDGGNDLLYGGAGDDVLTGGTATAGGTNQLWGGTGSDTASYADMTGVVYADLAAQSGHVGGVLVDQMNSIENLTGGTGNDVLVGDAIANVLAGGAGSDILYGQGGDDTLIGGGAASGGTNQLWGGQGSDTASYVGMIAVVYADLGALNAYLGGVLVDQMNSVENLIGGSSNDVLVGDAGNNVLSGGAGSDLLYGQDGDDILIGGAAAAGSTNQLWGGTGIDAASYAGTTGAVYADIGSLSAYVDGVLTDQMSSIENLIGSAGNDVLVGDANSNVLTGDAGGDVLYGQGGDDILIGGTAAAGSTNQLWGGTGTDAASYVGTVGAVYADLSSLSAYVDGVLVDQMSSIENLIGSAGSDVLVGDANGNVLMGGAGTDYLYGQDGNDTLIGGSAASGSANQLWGGTGNDTASYVGTTGAVYADLGAQAGHVDGVLVDLMNSIENLTGSSNGDTLVGNASANRIAGGAGGDALWGKGGADVFVYNDYADSNLVTGYDIIGDFISGTSKLDLTALGLDASHIVIQSNGQSTSLYIEKTAGVFDVSTDLAISLVGANAIAMGDLLL